VVNYKNTGGRWSGFARSNHFAVRWTGRLRIFKAGRYHFQIISDDGSKLWIDNRYTINNDGLHGWRSRVAKRNIRAGWRLVRLEMFERGGNAGMLFRYHGPDTGNRWAVARASGKRHGGHRATYRHGLFMENAFYFGQGGRCKNLNGRKPNLARWKHVRVSTFKGVCRIIVLQKHGHKVLLLLWAPLKDVNYRNTGGKWPGFHRSNHFAVRWTGRMRIFKTGHYHFGIISDDGSKLWFDNRYTINNDGLHGWRNRQVKKHVRAGWHIVRLEMFERGGHAGMLFRYHGPDTGNRWVVARARGRRHVAYKITYRAGLFRENAFYFGQGGRCQNLNGRKPNMARWKHVVNYRNTGGKWSGFHRSNHFAVRWTGRMRFFKSGRYHFQLISDDGSKLWIDNKYTINNDGLHGWRSRVVRRLTHPYGSGSGILCYGAISQSTNGDRG